MSNNFHSRFKWNHYIAFGVLFLLIFGAYSNTFQSSWHLDDYPNIIDNSDLHLKNLSPQSLYKTFFSHPWPLGNVYRPIPCLTFALNWYIGKGGVVGYHLVNITIHLLTAFFLYLTICSLYRSPKLHNRGSDNHELIAFLAACLWAVNPIQTQAVTYIVQRMASIAAMFYILGIFFYIKGRLCNVTGNRILLFLGCIVSYALAFGSKENAAAMPLCLLLVEIVFFQKLEDPKTTRKMGILAATAGVMLALAGIIFFIHMDDLSILKGYRQRSFDLPQRLMTQPGIIIFYLTQLFYPMPQRLSIEHHIDLATSLFEPWYTLPAICLILILIGLGFSQIKKRPIIACSILFFFINHLIESSILPLELVFEHRNYLPSLFLFWPLAVGMLWLVAYFRKKRRSIAISLVAFMILCVLGLGFSTYIRNMVWATDKTLWEDAMKKAPGRTRPVYNLAKYYFSTGELETALRLFKKSLKLKGSKPEYSQALSLNGIASIYYVRKDYEKVIALCRRALEISPGFKTASYNIALAQVKLGQWEKASDSVDLLLVEQKHQAGYLFMKGFILIHQNKPERALSYLREALKIKPGDRKTLLNTGISLSLIGQYKQAEWFFKQALNHSTRDIQTYFYLVDNSLKAGDPVMLERYLDKLTASFRIDTIKSGLTGRFDELFLIHPSLELIAPVIRAKLKKVAEEISGCGPG